MKYIVQLKAGVDLDSFLDELSKRIQKPLVIDPLPNLNSFIVDTDRETISVIMGMPGVRAIHTEEEVHIT